MADNWWSTGHSFRWATDTYNTFEHSGYGQRHSVQICLADAVEEGAEHASGEQVVLHEQYNQLDTPVTYPSYVTLKLDHSNAVFEQTVLVLEWVVTLFADDEDASKTVKLLHTLDHVRQLNANVKRARWLQWGHLYTPLSECVEAASESREYTFTLAYKPNDLEVEYNEHGTPENKADTRTVGAEAMKIYCKATATKECDEREADEDDEGEDEGEDSDVDDHDEEEGEEDAGNNSGDEDLLKGVDLSKWKVVELKAELADRGLAVSGRKADLVTRLAEDVAQ